MNRTNQSEHLISALSEITPMNEHTVVLSNLDESQSLEDAVSNHFLSLYKNIFKKIKVGSIITIRNPIFTPLSVKCKTLKVLAIVKPDKRVLVEYDSNSKLVECNFYGTGLKETDPPLLLLEDLRPDDHIKVDQKYRNKKFFYESIFSVRPAFKNEKDMYHKIIKSK